MTPLVDPNHLSPTGMRVVAPIPDDDSPYPEGFPELALQRYLGEKSRRRAAEAVVTELEMEVGRLRDIVSEKDTIISRLQTSIAVRDLAIDSLKQEIYRLTGLVNELIALKDARMWEIKELKDALNKSNAGVSRLRDALAERDELIETMQSKYELPDGIDE